MSEIHQQQALRAYTDALKQKYYRLKLWEEADRDAKNKYSDLSAAQHLCNEAHVALLRACGEGRL